MRGDGRSARVPAGIRAGVRVCALATAAVAIVGCAQSEGGGWVGTREVLDDGTVVVTSPAEGTWDEETRWSLVEEGRVGALEGDGPEVFGRIGDYEVDREGRLHVLASQASEVRVFGPDGSHLTTFGRAGEGPGEFGRPAAIELDPEGRIWVVDTGNGRYSIYEPDGALVDDRRRFTHGQVFPWPGTIFADGRVVDVDFGFVDGKARRTYMLFQPDGTLLDTLVLPEHDQDVFTLTTESSRTNINVPFTPSLERAWDPAGHLWAGVSDDYRIARTDPTSGDTTMVVVRAHDPVPVTGAEIDAAVEQMAWFRERGGEIERSRIPGEHPPFEGMFVDDAGYLWVEPTLPLEGEVTAETLSRPRPAAFDVFDDEGVYLGRVEAAIPLVDPVVRGDRMYARTLDDLGVNYIVRLRIEGRDEGSP